MTYHYSIPRTPVESEQLFMPNPITTHFREGTAMSKWLACHSAQAWGKFFLIWTSCRVIAANQWIDAPAHPTHHHVQSKVLPQLMFGNREQEEATCSDTPWLPQDEIEPYSNKIDMTKFGRNPCSISVDADGVGVERNILGPWYTMGWIEFPILTQGTAWCLKTSMVPQEMSHRMWVHNGPILQAEFIQSIIQVFVLYRDLDTFHCLGKMTLSCTHSIIYRDVHCKIINMRISCNIDVYVVCSIAFEYVEICCGWLIMDMRIHMPQLYISDIHTK